MIAFVCIADEKYAKKYSKYIQSQKNIVKITIIPIF
jgi:hypothetical protein